MLPSCDHVDTKQHSCGAGHCCLMATERGILTATGAAHAPAAGIDTDAAFADFDTMVEGWLNDEDRQPRRKARAAPRDAGVAGAAEAHVPRTVCARCHSLTHNGCAQSPCIKKLGGPLRLVTCACAGSTASADWQAVPMLHEAFAAWMALVLHGGIMGLSHRASGAFACSLLLQLDGDTGQLKHHCDHDVRY